MLSVNPPVKGEEAAAVVIPPSVRPPVTGAAVGAALPNAKPDPPRTKKMKYLLWFLYFYSATNFFCQTQGEFRTKELGLRLL